MVYLSHWLWGKSKEKIGLNDEYEEYAIHDYELPFTVDEYTSIGELNRLWEMVSELPEELQSELSALLTHFSSIEELSEHQEDIIIHSDCDDMYDVARYYIEETGALGEVPASLQNYIDYQAYGRDLDLSGTFISTNHGIFWNRLLNLSVHYYWQIFYFTGVAQSATPIFLWKDWLHEENTKLYQYLVCGKGTVFYQWF